MTNRSFLNLTFASIVVANVVGIAAYSFGKRELVRAKEDFSSHIDVHGMLDGGGQPFPDDFPDTCALVSYTSTQCHFCQLEKTPHSQLEELAKRSHCVVRVLVPDHAEADPSDAAHNVYYVPESFTKGFRSRLLPTTVLINKDGMVVWSKVGSLTEGDVAHVENAMVTQR